VFLELRRAAGAAHHRPDLAALQRHERHRRAGDAQPLGAESGDDRARKAQRVDDDAPPTVVHAFQAELDFRRDAAAPFAFVHRRAVEVGEDRPASQELRVAQEALHVGIHARFWSGA
jgi:hypothetical protein